MLRTVINRLPSKISSGQRFVTSNNSSLITVFYDGACGLCSKEINHYRKIAPPDVFNWQDITKCDSQLKAEGITLADGLKLLHAKNTDGTIHIGVDAFILIWQQLNRWRILAVLVSIPGVRQIVDFAYRSFANRRFKHLEHCQAAAKQKPG